jgi:hypothetical protein
MQGKGSMLEYTHSNASLSTYQPSGLWDMRIKIGMGYGIGGRWVIIIYYMVEAWRARIKTPILSNGI